MKEDEKIMEKFDAALRGRRIFDLAEKIVKKIPKAEVYLVGGAVRDVILGRPVKDIDILVRKASPADLEKFLQTQGKVDLVGKRFSVFKFTPKNPPQPPFYKGGSGWQIDIALPRTDFSYGTGGYKDVKVKSNPNLAVEEDLARRDFTVNALAWNVLEKKIIDPYGGLRDLKKKIIKTVGLPKERFAEDYSRMLRAARFAMQLDFKIERGTWAAIKKYIGRINDLAKTPSNSHPLFLPLGKGENRLERGRGGMGERKVPYEVIASEFLKSFSAAPRKTIEMYFDCGAMKKLMPEFLAMKKCSQPKEHHSEGNVLTHTLIALDNINSKMFKEYFPEPVSLTAQVAILLHDVGKPKSKKKMDGRTVFYNHDKIGAGLAKKFLERMKFSAPPDIGIDAEEVAWLIGNHLLFFYSPPEQMKKTTLEKYLFNRRFSGLAHMQLFLADAMATKPEKIKLDLTRFKKAYKLWRSFQKTEKSELPMPILNGDAVMKILKIAPGPKVGEILNLLREEQLNGRIKTKKDAEKFIKKI